MRRRDFIGQLLTAMTLASAGASAQEHREERCEHLAREEHELRERYERERDFEDRERIGHRLREIDEERARECRPRAPREEHCEHLAREEHELRERYEHERDFEDRERIGHRLREIGEERERECRRH